MRAGVIHAAGNLIAAGLYAASLTRRGPRAGRLLRLAGLAAVSASGLLSGHISSHHAGGPNHAEEVPHLVEPGWQHLMLASDLPEGSAPATAPQPASETRQAGGTIQVCLPGAG
jgi:hypothetical protein